VDDFRLNTTLICGKNGSGIWSKLDNAFRSSVGSDFVMTLPSGRKMRYEDVRCSTRIVPNKKTGKPERKSEFPAIIGGRRVTTYGGKLTENIVQATARDVFVGHQLAMEKAGWRNLFGVYDEAVLEVDPSVTKRDVEEAMSVCPEWLAGCPIGAEAKEVAHYLK
jgi:DNA polymerase